MALVWMNTGSLVLAQEEGETKTIIQYRKIFMEAKEKHHQAIKLLVTKELSLPSHVITHAEALKNMANDMLLLFPKDSMGAKSRVSPNIWNKDGSLSQGFIAQVEKMKEEATKMVKVAQAGDMAAVQKQLRSMTADGCRSCHTLYRIE